MKKQIFFSIVFIATLMVFSMVFTPAVFAGSSTHTITIVNQSSTALVPTNNPHMVIYDSTNSACVPAVPPDTCTTVNFTPPASVLAGKSATINITGPTSCNVSMWQTYYSPSGRGKQGTIRCTISPIGVCNTVSKNYTCTITQANVDAVTGNSNIVNGTAQ